MSRPKRRRGLRAALTDTKHPIFAGFTIGLCLVSWAGLLCGVDMTIAHTLYGAYLACALMAWIESQGNLNR